MIPELDSSAGTGPGPGPPTVKDVARVAGVSTATVSRVVNGNAHVSEAARTAVLRAIKTLGYERNEAAASVRRMRNGR